MNRTILFHLGRSLSALLVFSVAIFAQVDDKGVILPGSTVTATASVPAGAVIADEYDQILDDGGFGSWQDIGPGRWTVNTSTSFSGSHTAKFKGKYYFPGTGTGERVLIDWDLSVIAVAPVLDHLNVTGATQLGSGTTYVTAIAAAGDVDVEAVFSPAVSASALPAGYLNWTGGNPGADILHRKVPKNSAGSTVITATSNSVAKSATVIVYEVTTLAVTGATRIGATDNYVTKIEAAGDVMLEATLNPAASASSLPANFISWTGGVAGADQLHRTVTKTAAAITDVTVTVGSSSKTAKIIVAKIDIVVPARVIPRVASSATITIQPSLPSGVNAVFDVRNSGVNGNVEYVNGANTLSTSGSLDIKTPASSTSSSDPGQTQPGHALGLKLGAKIAGVDMGESNGFTVSARPTGLSQSTGSVVGNNLKFTYTWNSDSGALADLDEVWLGEFVTYSDGGIHVNVGRPWLGNNFDPTVTPNTAVRNGPTGGFTDTHSPPGGLPAPGPTDTFTATQTYGYHDFRTDPTPDTGLASWQTVLIGPIAIVRSVTKTGTQWYYSISKSGISALIPVP